MDLRINLPESEIPTAWYNVMPHLPSPVAPPLDPQTHEPIDPAALAAIFPESLIAQEMSDSAWIEIPQPVRDVYRIWRPTPLVRARRLEEALGVKSRIYYKDESLSPAGSHKPNTAVPQAYYNKQAGLKRLATETGAGQWGTALSFASRQYGLDCTVYMVKVSFEQKPYRGILIRSYGATIHPSPSVKTQSGRAALEQNPDHTGSLGLAISEAVEDAATHDDTNYALGSVLNHVLIHQTVTGLETKKQLALAGEKADILVGCVGGGSNAAGLFAPFVPERLDGHGPEMIAIEPMACPTLTKGEFRYDYGDVARLTPLIKMHTLGHSYTPPPIHAGGLRYHGNAPILCQMVDSGLIRAQAYYQKEVFEAAMLFLQTEGFLPAPETAHAIKGAIEAAKAAEPGQTVVFLYSGHGLLDLAAYDAYLSGKLTNYEYPDEEIAAALKSCPEI
ncbi:MAG: TrpB-like pyridoxal phosphate-dependent enzyme [Oceanidesulfovibrio sp.]